MATKYQQRIERYAQKHGVSIAEARAHAQGTHGNVQRVTPIPGGVIYETNSAQRVRAEVARAATQGQRVEIEVTTKDGEKRRLWQHHANAKNPQASKYQGVPAERVAKKLGKTAGSTKGGIASQSGYDKESDYEPETGLEVDEIASYAVSVYY